MPYIAMNELDVRVASQITGSKCELLECDNGKRIMICDCDYCEQYAREIMISICVDKIEFNDSYVMALEI